MDKIYFRKIFRSYFHVKQLKVQKIIFLTTSCDDRKFTPIPSKHAKHINMQKFIITQSLAFEFFIVLEILWRQGLLFRNRKRTNGIEKR